MGNNFPTDGSKKVYVVGEVGIGEELELAGIPYTGGPDDAGKTSDLSPGLRLDQDPDVGAVIVGFDRNINYHKIQYATLCIRETPAASSSPLTPTPSRTSRTRRSGPGTAPWWAPSRAPPSASPPWWASPPPSCWTTWPSASGWTSPRSA